MQAKPNFIVSLSDASAGLSQVGGKGASLARMAAACLPVPPGFHITTAAYRRFVAEHELSIRLGWPDTLPREVSRSLIMLGQRSTGHAISILSVVI